MRLAKIFKKHDETAATFDNVTRAFYDAGRELMDTRKTVKALERERATLLHSVADVTGLDYRSLRSAFLESRKEQGAVRGDNKISNAELLEEWKNSSAEERSTWDHQPWESMRSRLELEGQQTSRASVIVQEDVDILRSILDDNITSYRDQSAHMSYDRRDKVLRRISRIQGHVISRRGGASGSASSSMGESADDSWWSDLP
ncbi:hypothetical protein L202_07204 [Cryptococcus amylolentus CBS 6039]|uniref:Uncharacterized protein n=2 Tax=Cryptococcus amylolentus TaxID=104669 RepID=A0A1E3HBE4_9TREE|nr:hypothetical protein L202_07204 [Cryptococcus amylolentus CBS 6039]ODN73657.1 hypothetical protein L202_07204 [Cryptococcus amylolentus CBS 6039]ODO00448.1 hypothetical protein I350_07089 [Cryptococcus amylolentus CBS 6273]